MDIENFAERVPHVNERIIFHSPGVGLLANGGQRPGGDYEILGSNDNPGEAVSFRRRFLDRRAAETLLNLYEGTFVIGALHVVSKNVDGKAHVTMNGVAAHEHSRPFRFTDCPG